MKHLLLTLFALTSTAAAQEWGSWWTIGPFDHPQGVNDVATVQSVERELKFLGVDGPGMDLARDHPGKGAVELHWKELGDSAGKLDVGAIEFAKVLDAPVSVQGWHENAVAYVYRTITCPRPLDLAVRTGSDDGIRFWLNGELLIDKAVARGLNVSDHSLNLSLREGVNHLLVEVANGGGGWGYQLAGWSKIPQAAIDGAIDRGVQMLLRHQLLDGSWPGYGGYGDGLTAYSAYCLLKSGVPVAHPAVQRAKAFVLANPTHYTYSVACELLFLCTLQDPALESVIEGRLDDLIDFQEGSGLWAYPVHPGGNVLPHDLSNTLYVALALRACETVGVPVPQRVWTRLLEGTLRCFEGIEGRAAPTTGPSLGPGAGFSYRPHGHATGSMTTAGVSIIEICRQNLGGELPGKYRSEAMRAKRAGLAWLAENMDWGGNPGHGNAHHYFFIYGMERVGSILDLEHVGGLNWYWDGAQWLVKAQQGSGGWSGGENYVDTILALLFLRRASAPSTGEKTIKVVADRWATDDPQARVQLAASGKQRKGIWILGFSDAERARLEFPGDEGKGPRVEQVTYFARPKGEGEFAQIGVAQGNGEQPSRDQRYGIQHEFPRSGDWELYADVAVRVPAAEEGLVPGREELAAPVLTVQVGDVLRPEQLGYAGQRTESLFHGIEVVATSSSQAGNQLPQMAVDGSQESRWHCNPNDAHPWLRLAVTRPVKGSTLLLSHAHPRQSQAGAPQPSTVEVIVNGKERYEVQMDPDPMCKTALVFPKDQRVRELELRILTAHQGELGKSAVGFAEVEFLRVR
ncbi:MAG: hypothetical protein O2816_05895 [Planctomycetota bacterium]|nr:hypothetical protein [Planctomycetota bacterium]